MPILSDADFFGASPPAPAAAPASGAAPSSRLLSDAEFFGGGGSATSPGAGGRLLSDDEFFSGAPAPSIRFDQSTPVPSADDNEDLAARNDAARASMPPLSGLLGLEGNPPAETPAQNAQGQAEAEQVAQQGTADSGAGSLGRAMKAGGDALRDVAGAYAFEAIGQPELQAKQIGFENEQIGLQPREGEPDNGETPIEQGMRALPAVPQVASRAVYGGLESAPQFGAMLGLDALGVPAPVAAAVAFGSTEHGFDPQSAAVAAAIPYVGKYTGDIVSSLAGKLGVSSERALQIFHGAGGAAGATAYLGTIQASEIANLPPEQRRGAVIDAIAGNLAMLPLSFMGGGSKGEQEATEETEVNKNEPQHAQVKTEPLNQNVENGENVNQPSAPISAESLAELQAAMTANQVTPPRLMGRELAESLRAGPTEAESGAPNQTPAPESQAEPSTESTTIVPPGETPGGGTGPTAAPRRGFWLRPRSDGVPDILDSIQELGGIRPPGPDAGGEYDGWSDAMQGGARLLVNRNAAHTPDTLIEELHDNDAWQRIQTPDDLWNAISSAVEARANLRASGDETGNVPGGQADAYGAVYGPRLTPDQVRRFAELEGESFQLSAPPGVEMRLQVQPNKLWLTALRKVAGESSLYDQAVAYLHIRSDGQTVLDASHHGRDLDTIAADRLVEFLCNIPSEKEARPGEPKQRGAVRNWLDRAIEATDARPGQLMEGVTGAPVWLTKAAANGALRVEAQRKAVAGIQQEPTGATESEAKPGLIRGSAAEKWADDVLRGGQTSSGPDVLAAYAVKGAALIEGGLRDFASWSAEMVRQFGEAIKPHLQELWQRATPTFVVQEDKAGLYGSRYMRAVIDGHPWKIRISDHDAGQSANGPGPESAKAMKAQLLEAATMPNAEPFNVEWRTDEPKSVSFKTVAALVRKYVAEEFYTHPDAKFGGTVWVQGRASEPEVEVEGGFDKVNAGEYGASGKTAQPAESLKTAGQSGTSLSNPRVAAGASHAESRMVASAENKPEQAEPVKGVSNLPSELPKSTAADPVGGFLDRAIAATDAKPGQLMEGVTGNVPGGQADAYGAVYGPRLTPDQVRRFAELEGESFQLSAPPGVEMRLQVQPNKLWLTALRKVAGESSLYDQAVAYLHIRSDGQTVLDASHHGRDLDTIAADRLVEFLCNIPSEKEARPGEPKQRGAVRNWLDRAIEATDARPGQLMEGVTGAPVWLTKAAANGALRAVRLAWRAGKAIHEAIEEGVNWLRLNAPKAFQEEEARDWLASSVEAARQAGAKGYGEALEKLAGSEVQSPKANVQSQEDELPLQGRAQIEARREEINTRLNEINATRRAAGSGLPDELKSERYQLAKEDRGLLRQLSNDPGYVADLLKRIDGLGNDLQRARAAGYGAQAIHLGHEMDGLMNGDLALVPDELRSRVYADLVARGEIGGSQLGPVPAGRTLNGLTAWLNANKLDSPKLSLLDRLNLSQKLAEDWNAGKDKLSGLVNKLSASWQAFKAQYQAPPVDTEFRKLVKDWLFEKQWTGLETHNWLRSLRLSVTAPLRRQAMSVWMDAGGDPRVIESQRDLVPPRFRPVWDTALKLTDGEKNLARQVQSDFRGKLEDAQNMGLLDKGREDYGVPQIWKTPPKNEGGWEPGDAGGPGRAPRNPMAKLDPRDPFFALKRSNPSYFDGIMQGGVPKSLDLGDLVAVYNAQFHDALADRGLIKNLKDAKGPDGQPIVAIGGGTRVEPGAKPGERTFFVDSKWNGDHPVAADGRPYRAVDHWALRGWKFAARDADGNPILVRGDFLVHPDYWGFLKNELGKSWLRDPDGGGKYFNPIFESAAFLKASKFASATFHMATLAEHSAFHAFAGQPSAERLGLLWPSIKGVELDPLRNPELAGLMRHGMELGFGGGREFFEEGLASHGGIWSHAPGLGQAMGRLTDFLFQDYMPRLKAKTAAAMLHANQERYEGKLSPEQIMELTAHQANAAFGAQNWRLLGTNKTLLDANRLLLTAPDFLLSRAKVVAQALKPYHAEQRYFLLAQAALVYTAARVLNQLLDGNPHWEAANALRVVYKGRSYGARFLVSDVANMVQDPATFWQGRLGPLPRTAIEASTGRDIRTGARIDVPFNVPALRSAEIAVKDLAEWLVPIGAEGLLPGAAGREQTKLGQASLALAGVSSRKYTAETQMWDAAAKFNRSSPEAKSVLYQKTRDNEAGQASSYRKLDDLLDAGQLDRARAEYDALEKEGKDGASIFRRYAAVNRPFAGSLAREIAFKKSLSPADNAVYQKAIGERLVREAAFEKMLNQPSSIGGRAGGS